MLKKYISFPVFLLVLLSCNHGEDKAARQVIISGEVSNFNPRKNKIELHIYRVCEEKEIITSTLDSTGRFDFKFKTFVPLETELMYKTELTVLTHPGDSIFVKFNGSQKNPQLLNNVLFGGSSSKLNNDITDFKRMLYTDYIALNKVDQSTARMLFDILDYDLYLDTMQQGFDNFIGLFNEKISPCNEAIGWGKFYLKQITYDAMISYSFLPDIKNNSKPRYLNFPVSFYNRILDVTPIDYSLFLNSKDLPRFINAYWIFYAHLNLVADEAYKLNKAERGYLADVTMNDSLEYAGIIKYTPDKLLRQIIITEKEVRNLERLHIESYEKNQDFINQEIEEPFLKEVLSNKYAQTFDKLNNPQIASNAILRKIQNSPAESIMDSILNAGAGKVIYIDCWADWCGPCLAELPNSKKLEEELNGKDVEFVYVCLKSKEDVWKAIISKHQLKGQHYFLSKNQSEEWEKSFNISGVPYYFLIDKNGTIVENGSYLKPNVAKGRIEKLLKE